MIGIVVFTFVIISHIAIDVDALAITPPQLHQKVTPIIVLEQFVPPNHYIESTNSPTSNYVVSEGINAWWLATTEGSSSVMTAVTTTTPPPSTEDITLLRNAFAEMYRPIKNGSRDYEKAYQLLTQAIERWEQQPDDERAGLYRVRGDCNMIRTTGNTVTDDYELANGAYKDYSMAVTLLQKPGVRQLADPQEYSASLLGRARATKSLSHIPSLKTDEQRRYAKLAADNYRTAIIELGRLSSNMDDDDIYDDNDRLEEGLKRNPYAAWEWGDSLWKSGSDYIQASNVYMTAATSFDEIGDRPRSVISQIDAGIALAAAAPNDQDVSRAISILQNAVKSTVGVQSRDVPLLQRVITKEGEGRMALAALLWSDGQRLEAESILGEACVRLDQLQAQVDLTAKRNDDTNTNTMNSGPRLLYSIDDNIVYANGGSVLSCSDFKKPQFLSEKLKWPDTLQKES